MSRNTNIEYFTNSVRPELVEGHSGGYSGRFRKGFDRLSPNGMFVSWAGDLT